MLQVIIKHAQATAEPFHRHGGGNIRDLRQAREVMNSQAQHAQHAVSAIDQRQALFFFQHQGFDAMIGQGVGGGDDGAVGTHAHKPLAHERQGAVRQRGQIPRAAQRPVLMHHRSDSDVEHGSIGGRHHWAHTRAARGQGGQAQQHQGAHNLALHLGAATRSVGTHEAALQLGAKILGNVTAGQRAETGGNTVNGGGVVG